MIHGEDWTQSLCPEITANEMTGSQWGFKNYQSFTWPCVGGADEFGAWTKYSPVCFDRPVTKNYADKS